MLYFSAMQIPFTRYFLFLMLLFLNIPSHSQSEFDVGAKTLKEEIQDTYTNHEIIGLSAAILHEDKIVFESSVGYANLTDSILFGPNTLTRIASIIKPMTAIAIMQLVEKGEIDLDIEIQNYVADFPVKEKGTITVRQLLNHTAGIPSYNGMKEIDNRINYPTLSDAVANFEDRALVSVPGTEYHYSSYGYTLLGLIIEKVSGMSYEAYMQENIWDKAGMQHTAVEVYGHVYPNKSLLYKKNKDGSFSELDPTNLSDRIPGGGVYSTVEDVLRFGNALLENLFIQKSTFEQMLVDPEDTIDNSNYGLGWYIYSEKQDYGDAFGHTGSQRGASGQLIIIPEENTVIVVLSNTSSSTKLIKYTAAKLYQETQKTMLID